jgi:hypothetical protein
MKNKDSKLIFEAYKNKQIAENAEAPVVSDMNDLDAGDDLSDIPVLDKAPRDFLPTDKPRHHVHNGVFSASYVLPAKDDKPKIAVTVKKKIGSKAIDDETIHYAIDGAEDMGDSVSKKELDGILSDFDALKAEHNID